MGDDKGSAELTSLAAVGRQVDSIGAVLCCWLHMTRLAVSYLAKTSPVLQVRQQYVDADRSS